MQIVLNEFGVDHGLPGMPVSVYCGSSLPVEVYRVERVLGARPSNVSVSVVNADGVTVIASLSRGTDGVYRCRFAADNFANYGTVIRGFKIAATLSDGQVQTLHVADLDVKAATPSATPGDPCASYQVKGGQEYLRSSVVDGVQHYKLVSIAYDATMGDWGFNLSGDYILVNGEFVEVES